MSRACELGLSGSLFLYNTTQFLQIAPSSLDIASEGSTKGASHEYAWTFGTEHRHRCAFSIAQSRMRPGLAIAHVN